MTLVSVLLLAGVAAIIGVGFCRPAVSTVAFVALVPFYYVIRGTAGQSAFAFLWPYVVMAGLAHALGVRALLEDDAPGPARLKPSDRRTLVVLYALLAAVAIGWWRFVATTLTRPLGDAIGQFNDYRIVVFGAIAAAVVCCPVLIAMRRQQAMVRKLTVLDWTMAAFLGYGGLQLALSLVRTHHLFYSLESFRYYFVMAGVYFVVRFGLATERQARIAATMIVGAAVVVGAEFIVEHFLFNNGVSSLQLPWLSAFDSLFKNYGRPIAADEFVVMTAYSDTVTVPYSGVRGMGLFIHPHTAGLFMTMGSAFLSTWVFNDRARRWLWLLAALSLLVYGVVLTMSRTAAILLYAVLALVPPVASWLLHRSIERVRALTYVAVVAVTVFVASNFSPGGPLPHFRLGWYERPILFTFRAVAGDLLAWNSAVAHAPRGDQVAATEVAATEVAATEVAATQVAATQVAATQVPGHDSSSMRDSAATAGQALQSKMTPLTLLVGQGFSPLTRYVVDFFPEAASYRHVYSTSDMALLEFFQQFGALGLGLLLAMFVAFGFAGIIDARRWRDRPTGLIAFATATVVAVTLIGMLHLYPLFRMGVNSSFYALLGILGLLHASDRSGHR